MKADPSAQLALLDLQQVDATLAQLDHRRKKLPLLAELADLEQRSQDVADRISAQRNDVDDLSREQKKADRDVEQVKQRQSRDQARLDSGQVSDPRQMEALQHEIGTLTKRISDLEDVELEVMERFEEATTRLSDLEAEAGRTDEQVAVKRSERDDALAEIERARSEQAGEREEIAPRIPADLMALYDKLRAQFGGVAAGALKQGRCEGCRLDVGQAEMRRLKTVPPDEVVRCEECNRILVRTPESGL